MTKKREFNLRALSTELETRAEGNKGFFSGYFSKFGRDNIDSHRTYFTKGAFKKTIEERFNKSKKVKLLYNHQKDIPIGVPLVIREDDVGVYFEAQLNLKTSLGKDVYELMKQGAINTMSFGFYIIKSAFENDGVERITEVSLLEISPVVFASNENAEIQKVRSEDLSKQVKELIMKEQKPEQEEQIRNDEDNKVEIEFVAKEENEERAEDFNETLENQDLSSFNYKLQRVLEVTLSDIFWKNDINEDLISKLDKAIVDFHSNYLEMATKFVTKFGEAKRSDAFSNEYQKRFSDYLDNNEKDFDSLVRSTPLTEDDIKALQSGKAHFVAASKLDDLDEELRNIVNDSKVENIKTLKSEIRTSDISKADKKILSALLFTTEDKKEAPVQEERAAETEVNKEEAIISEIESFLKNLNK